MNFELSEEQKMIVATTRAFVEGELYPHEDEVEATGHLSDDLVQKIKVKHLKQGYMLPISQRNMVAQA